MSESRYGQAGRGFFLKLMLAVLLLTVASVVVVTILSRVLFQVFVNGVDTTETYSLVLALYFLGYLVVYFLVFYFIGLRSGILVSRYWFVSLEYLFIGALLGGALGFIAEMGVDSAFFGAQFGLGPTTIIYWLSLIVGFVQGAGEDALMAFAALAVGSFLRSAPNQSPESRELRENDQTTLPNGLS